MRKKLHQYIAMVNVIAVLLSQTQIASVKAEPLPEVPDFVTQYDALNDKLSVQINMPEASKKFVTAVIAPNGNQTNSITDLENDDVILRTVQVGLDGKVNFNIVMPDNAKTRYVYKVTVGQETKRAMFSTVYKDDVAAFLSSVNSGGLIEAKSFVQDETLGLSDLNPANKDYIANYINEVKPNGGYTNQTLLNAYLIGEGMYYIKNSSIRLNEFFELYSHYFENDYLSDYNKLSETMKIALEAAFVNNAVEESFNKTYNNNIFVAEYTTAENAISLKESLISYYENNNLSLTAFNSIGNEVYKEKVFDELYKLCSTVKTLATIKQSFNDEVIRQTEAANKEPEIDPGSGSGGGGASGSKGEISMGIANPDFSNAEDTAVKFTDVDGHWSENAVKEMVKRGVINGFEDFTYRPEASVTRAEFVKMVSKILGLDEIGESGFSDVNSESWYSKYIAATKNAGLISGTNGRFMPNENITRQDAAVIVARMLDYKKKTINITDSKFSDEALISDYAKEAVDKVASVGIIQGYDGKFTPLNNIKRGEVAALLMRASDYIM